MTGSIDVGDRSSCTMGLVPRMAERRSTSVPLILIGRPTLLARPILHSADAKVRQTEGINAKKMTVCGSRDSVIADVDRRQ